MFSILHLVLVEKIYSLCIWIFLRFEISRKLGQGTYGKVQLGINKETGQQVRNLIFQLKNDFLFINIFVNQLLSFKVAIKTIKKSKIETEADLIRIRREIQIMSSVQHPNIIHIYEGIQFLSDMFVTNYWKTGPLFSKSVTIFFQIPIIDPNCRPPWLDTVTLDSI